MYKVFSFWYCPFSSWVDAEGAGIDWAAAEVELAGVSWVAAEVEVAGVNWAAAEVEEAPLNRTGSITGQCHFVSAPTFRRSCAGCL